MFDKRKYIINTYVQVFELNLLPYYKYDIHLRELTLSCCKYVFKINRIFETIIFIIRLFIS